MNCRECFAWETNSAVTLCRIALSHKQKTINKTHNRSLFRPAGQSRRGWQWQGPQAGCQGQSPPRTGTRCCLAETLATCQPFCLARIRPIHAHRLLWLCQSCVYCQPPCQQFSVFSSLPQFQPSRVTSSSSSSSSFPKSDNACLSCMWHGVSTWHPEMSQWVPLPPLLWPGFQKHWPFPDHPNVSWIHQILILSLKCGRTCEQKPVLCSSGKQLGGEWGKWKFFIKHSFDNQVSLVGCNYICAINKKFHVNLTACICFWYGPHPTPLSCHSLFFNKRKFKDTKFLT